jgi:hypothetical protein
MTKQQRYRERHKNQVQNYDRERKRKTIRQGEICFIVTFERDWPNVSIIPAMVRAVDLVGRVYIVSIEGRLRTVASERVFESRAEAEGEGRVQAAVNWRCYGAEPSDQSKDGRKDHLTESFYEEI